MRHHDAERLEHARSCRFYCTLTLCTVLYCTVFTVTLHSADRTSMLLDRKNANRIGQGPNFDAQPPHSACQKALSQPHASSVIRALLSGAKHTATPRAQPALLPAAHQQMLPYSGCHSFDCHRSSPTISHQRGALIVVHITQTDRTVTSAARSERQDAVADHLSLPG